MNSDTREVHPLKLWGLLLQNHTFRKYSPLLWVKLGVGSRSQLTLLLTSRRYPGLNPCLGGAAVSSVKGVVSDRPSQFDLEDLHFTDPGGVLTCILVLWARY